MGKKISYLLVGFACIAIAAAGIVLAEVRQAPSGGSEAERQEGNPKVEMIRLIGDLHAYAVKKNPSFELMGNNGLGIYNSEDVTEQDTQYLLSSISGIIMEEYNYGWEMKDDSITPGSARREMQANLTIPMEKKVPVLNIDYCRTEKHVANGYAVSAEKGFIEYAAPHRQLDSLPETGAHYANTVNIRSLSDVKNFLVLLNPDKFKHKAEYLAALAGSEYDLIIVDSLFDGVPLSAEEVASLKHKPQGGDRLVFAYLSLGEAEDYRSYWKKEWSAHRPDWIAEENESWNGNYKVKFWTTEWRQIVFGAKDALLDQILAQGFDGSFLDVIDAYDYFMQ